MTFQGSIKPESPNQQELDSIYSTKYLSIVEKIYGIGWQCPGGETLVKEFLLNLGLCPGRKVLDIGSGIGGAAFYLSRQYGVKVEGVDLSQNAIQTSKQRLSMQEESMKSRVHFTFEDILRSEFPKGSFDVILSFCTLIHIREKEILVRKIKEWLKPGGKLVIYDYCRGDNKPSDDLLHLAAYFKFSIHKIEETSNILKDAGLTVLTAKDTTERFLDKSKEELKYFLSTEAATIKEFGKEAYEAIISEWELKIRLASSKEIVMAYFHAENLA